MRVIACIRPPTVRATQTHLLYIIPKITVTVLAAYGWISTACVELLVEGYEGAVVVVLCYSLRISPNLTRYYDLAAPKVFQGSLHSPQSGHVLVCAIALSAVAFCMHALCSLSSAGMP